MIFLCLGLNFFFNSEKISPVESWVNEQAKALEKVEADNPAEQNRALFSQVFITRHVTADDSTLVSDWGKVTADGSVSFPQPVDSWELAERMRRVAEKMKWDVRVSDTDMGPCLLLGRDKETQATLLKHGQYGRWSRFKGKTPPPKALGDEQWQQVLKARQLELSLMNGTKVKNKDLKIDGDLCPTMAVCAILRGDEIKLDKILDWLAKWPLKQPLAETALKMARKEKNKALSLAIIELGKENPSVNFYIEAALWEREQGHADISIQMLENGLKIDPHHSRCCQLLIRWRQK
jgi:hypothetical protein